MTKGDYRLTTNFQPIEAGVLSALAAREDPKRKAANQVLGRLLREELDRTIPGLWDELTHETTYGKMAKLQGPEQSAAVQRLVSERLRARGQR